MFHCNLMLALRIDLGLPDHVKPGPEYLLLKKMYAQFLHFFLQISQVLGMRKGIEVRQIISQRIRANKQYKRELQQIQKNKGHWGHKEKKITWQPR